MNYAILVDLNSMRLSYDSFAKAIASIDGKIAYAKLYGYNNPSSIFKNVKKDGKKVFTLKLVAGAAKIKLN